MPGWDRIDAVLALLRERPEGVTPGEAWRAVTDAPEAGEAEFRWDIGTLIATGSIERDGALWRIGTGTTAEVDFGAGPWDVPDEPPQPMEEAGGLLLREGLWRGGSVFVPGARVWTAENAGHLAAAVADRCRHQDDFLDGLWALLPVCSDDVTVLLAEILALGMVPIGSADLAPVVKRRRVAVVLDEVMQPAGLPTVVDRAFDHGMAPPGTWRARDVWPDVQFLAEFAAMWLEQPEDVRELSREHEHAWYSLVLGAKGGEAAAQREALLYFGHPGAFVPVFSGTDKRAIAEGLATEIGYREPGETVDATLARICIAVQAETRAEVDFYAAPWRERWRTTALDEPAGRAWFVRDSYPGGGDFLGEWLHEGVVTVPVADRTGEWSSIGEGDLVLAGTRDVAHVGMVVGPEDTGGDDVRRPVRWLTERRPVELTRLAGRLTTDLERRERVVEMRADLAMLVALARALS